jgi:hypothetical protein
MTLPVDPQIAAPRGLEGRDGCGVLAMTGTAEPERQVKRRRASGSVYLDADFPSYGISLEVDGEQHDLPSARLADLLRDLETSTEGRTVVRIPLIAWRVGEEQVLDSLERLFESRGCLRPPLAS